MSMRRTRAMGLSPSGLKALDMDAPTRKPRKAKASSDKPPPTRNAPRAKSGLKRTNEDNVIEEPPAKKTRRTQVSERPRRINTSQQPSSTQDSDSPSSERELSSARTHPSTSEAEGDILAEHEEEGAALESDQSSESRTNKQQPTPPAEAPYSQNGLSLPSSAADAPRRWPHEVDVQAYTLKEIEKKHRDGRRMSNLIRMTRRHRDEIQEEEKALSDCDDDEWAHRFPLEMSRYYNVTNSSKKPSPGFFEWVKGSTAMFVVHNSEQDKTVAGDQSRPSMSNLTVPSLTSARLKSPAGRARPLTDVTIIAAVSASLDWFENNPSAVTPTPAEMTSLLEDFNRSKQAQATTVTHGRTSPPNAHRPDLQLRLRNRDPRTPRKRPAEYYVEDGLFSLRRHDDEYVFFDNDDVQTERQEALLTSEEEQVTSTVPNTPPPQQEQPEASRGWASALSASVIGNVLRTPVNWFTRRDRARHNASTTEPGLPKVNTKLSQSAKPQRHARPHAHSSVPQQYKTTSTKSRSLKAMKPNMQPSTPTPAPHEPRKGGRPDAHLPVHLRGVRFEDLSPRWQAVSQHMRKPEPVQEEENSEVDLPALLEIARQTREERRLKKELQEKAERIAREQASLQSDDDPLEERVGEKRKRKVTVRRHKVFSAKLGHSTFGMPTNIDDSSSDEDVQVEVDMPLIYSEQRRRRMTSPLKSSMRRQPQGRSVGNDVENRHDDEDENMTRPSKRLRFEDDDDAANRTNPSSLSSEEFHQQYRARPASGFIAVSPNEVARLQEARDEYEQHHPLIANNPADQEKLDEIYEFCQKMKQDSNLFKVLDAASRRASLERETGSSPSSESMVLQESNDERLNKVREKALQYKPKVPSGLHVTQIMSPIAERKLLGSIGMDPEVENAIWAIPENEIVAEDFGDFPYVSEGTVSREASLALA